MTRVSEESAPSTSLPRELTVDNGDVVLAGSLWLPEKWSDVTVLMHPGSGPSDRDNDVFFPPIRQHLLEAGIAVASFDKRGVGGSTGHWQEAAIVEQASDAISCLEALRADVSVRGRVGLFGHSQGGWVVVEAASRCPQVAFAVTSSGPGVTPAAQERWAMRMHMVRAGISADEVEEVERFYDRVISMMRAGDRLSVARQQLRDEGCPKAFEKLSLPVLPEDATEWDLFAALIDYDPRPALERIDVPVLALFGADDLITPVAESVAVFRESVRPDLLRVEVFADANHRLQTAEGQLVAGYLDTLADFVRTRIPD
jgi:uncharacterized protein